MIGKCKKNLKKYFYHFERRQKMHTLKCQMLPELVFSFTYFNNKKSVN